MPFTQRGEGLGKLPRFQYNVSFPRDGWSFVHRTGAELLLGGLAGGLNNQDDRGRWVSRI
jgi:hypothetical protein